MFPTFETSPLLRPLPKVASNNLGTDFHPIAVTKNLKPLPGQARAVDVYLMSLPSPEKPSFIDSCWCTPRMRVSSPFGLQELCCRTYSARRAFLSPDFPSLVFWLTVFFSGFFPLPHWRLPVTSRSWVVALFFEGWWLYFFSNSFLIFLETGLPDNPRPPFCCFFPLS